MSETPFTSHECNLEIYSASLKSGMKTTHAHAHTLHRGYITYR